jgi:hypothetical protein
MAHPTTSRRDGAPFRFKLVRSAPFQRGKSMDASPMPRLAMTIAAFLAASHAHAAEPRVIPEERANFFGDPFVQVTHAIAECPVPHGPEITRGEMERQTHVRAERGLRCYQEGKCRLPNAYMYDKDIVARVQKALTVDRRFAGTSIWAEGQRRWVWLKGCVRRPEDAQAAVELVRQVDDVERVFDELHVWK